MLQQIASPETEGSLTPVSQADIYPKLTTDGFQYRKEEEEKLKIEWKEYENEREVMRFITRRGKKVIVRQLRGLELQTARDIASRTKIAGVDEGSMIVFAVLHLAATFDGEQKPIEEIADMLSKDLGSLTHAASELNF